ncbi:hypothetical protein [Nocardiopsis sp. CNS-639]|uniref:hypothetical protein n=1 Tax=Nocardiopsis sp. CNS-639 TaxID=1169153 RepID=UPI00037B97B9|nr:hypothetical protein [Nocardiopsis sp. CNS-639]
MEAIGVPWFIAVRYLGPPLFLLAAGGALVLWRRPARPGLVWAALLVNLLAAALPFLWIGVQVLTGLADQTVHGLVMTLAQPAVAMAAWGLLLAAVAARPPGADRAGADRSARGPDRADRSRARTGDGGEPERTPENVG